MVSAAANLLWLKIEKGRLYKEEIGSGESLTDIIEQTQPAVEYIGVRIDPYFIVQ
jgi:hypothetical protein